MVLVPCLRTRLIRYVLGGGDTEEGYVPNGRSHCWNTTSRRGEGVQLVTLVSSRKETLGFTMVRTETVTVGVRSLHYSSTP